MQNHPPHYNPSIFDQVDINHAREIVLTPENGVSTQLRWETETPWLLSLIAKHIKPSGVVVDYGCGIGRIAGKLVEKGYEVVGVDSSKVMRQHATNAVGHDKFVAIAPSMLDHLVEVGMRVDSVLAIWMLQHCFDLEAEVKRIHRALNKGGIVGVLDMRHRAVPTDQGWINDGKSVKDTMCQYFTLIQQYPYNPEAAPPGLRDSAYVAFFKKINSYPV